MADFVKNLFGGSTLSASAGDSDFADFAGAPDPSSVSYSASSAASVASAGATATSNVVYTKWYRIWERTSPSDFKAEAMILPFMLVVLAFHVWGRRKNRRIADTWTKAHVPALQKEFALVGFSGSPIPTVDEVSDDGLLKSTLAEQQVDILKEKTGQEFTSYASGRQNTAFLDIKLTLYKRYNPITWVIEIILGVFFESFSAPTEELEATSYSFDGREKDIVPVATQAAQEDLEQRVKGLKSTYDGFVWAVVHKDQMRKLRDERYDVSLTVTKDNEKLPAWATVMSENAEITNTLLTLDLIKAIEQAGDENFKYLVVSDQPVDKPKTLQETVPRKRITLSLALPNKTDPQAYLPALPLFSYFLRFPDVLVSSARFRPEVTKKVRATREEEIRKLKRADDDEKAEERKLDADKKKKADRDAKLRLMSPEDQRKFLDKEREKGQRKMGKKQTVKG